MSAFTVSDTHINALVTFAVAERLTMRSPDDAGRLLLTENYRSVCHHYNEPMSNEAEAYSFKRYTKQLSPVAILKACDCLDYQSCEHDGWDGSDAKAFLDSIRKAATRKLLGYADAQWEIA